jgi:hypothetical protein
MTSILICYSQWRTEGRGLGDSNPPEILKFWQSWVKFPVPWKIHM